ncbi:3-hydroxyacyl-ACP dehydratase FabZ [Methylopila sp. M107]|uniref:3-hydroxyacyl-ACP dehydratase FabZ n=1 Tax=Methylopila sp. M107 TaxID=1101190 RepID=UPI00036F113E|nr:3-hydroxyacyl-ACP dehydratase FabZ [Methylopila sp. M107]
MSETENPTAESDAPKTLLAADIMQVLAALPHRYPFLLVDRIEEIDGDVSGVGVKNVTFNEPHFQGHFPGAPVMPGVLMIEGMAQTAGCMCIAARTAKASPRLVYFMTIDKAKFRKPVVPGDVVRYHMTQIKKRANMWWFKGVAKVDGKTVCEAEISAMIVDA